MSAKASFYQPAPGTWSVRPIAPKPQCIYRGLRLRKLNWKIETSGPAWVTVAQTFSHNWKLTVDRRRTRLWRANYAFQGFEVPAGRHLVEIVYRDWAFLSGAAISAATLLLCLVGYK